MAKRKQKKYRYNDPKTGKFKYTTSKKTYEKYRASQSEKLFQKESKRKDVFSITGAENIKKLLDQNKVQYQGFLTKEVKDHIYKFAKTLDEHKVKYTLGQIFDEMKTDADVRNKIIQVPIKKTFFHWNLHNQIRFEDISDVKFRILDVNGNEVYKGVSNERATEETLKQSKIIQSIENIALDQEKTNPYALIKAEMVYRNNKLISVTIDYSQIDNKNFSRIFEQYFGE